jgi:CBS domain-containing protein
MTAGEYCNREVIITGQKASVTEAAVLMRQHHVGDLVVVEKQGEKTLPIGIVTDRDIVVEVIAQKADPDSLIIKDIMSTGLITVGEKEALLDTLALMQNQGVRRIIVVDAQGNLQGIMAGRTKTRSRTGSETRAIGSVQAGVCDGWMMSACQPQKTRHHHGVSVCNAA